MLNLRSPATQAPPPAPPRPEAAPARLDLLAVTIGTQDFAIDIAAIREIRTHPRLTPVPRAPAHLRGVISLRGQVLPVVDLACRLGLSTPGTAPPRILVIVGIRARTLALLVTAVGDIVTLAEGLTCTAPPDPRPDTPDAFVRTVAACPPHRMRVLDLESILPPSRLATA